MNRPVKIGLLLVGLLSIIALRAVSAQQNTDTVTITLAGYAVPREAYGEIIPLFQAHWLELTGQQVIVQESYQASGAQSRAVAAGFEADIVALSIETDITRLVDAELITSDWNENEYGGIVTQSLVILTVRPGNPENIIDWADLARTGIEVITPDPATSGGAQWNILGAYGAARRGFVEGYEASDEGATAFLSALIGNIAVLDRDGRESFLTFERGIGNVAITYENEYFAGIAAGGEYEIVYPTSTILIENPVAVVEGYVDAHGTHEVAEAFVEFLYTPEAQRVFASHGFRPVNEVVRAEYGIVDEATAEETTEIAADVERNELIVFPSVEDLFTIEEFGGWAEARPAFFGDEGIFTLLIAQRQG
jgi:sulfate transport system substrate-binding protein